MEKSSQSKFTIFFFIFSVQDFLEKAKKDFEEQWSKNAKVSKGFTGIKFTNSLTFSNFEKNDSISRYVLTF